MKHKFARYILITGSVAAILLALILLLPNLGGNDAVKNSNINDPFNSDFGVKPLKLDGRQIEFSHTDDNSGENVIIKTDRKQYEGDSWANVYISITNTTETSQKSALLFYFLKEKNKDNMITIQQINGNERRYLTFLKNNIKVNSPALDIAVSKRQTMPDTFEIRSGTQIDIPAKKTIYLMARLEYLPGTSGEFWVEALGEKGAYGLLDPKYGTTVSTDTYASWYSNSWTYRRKITINEALASGSLDFSNFPVVINIDDETFKHTSFGGKVASSSAGITGGGGDFVFTSSDGTTKLDHEIEKYASSSGELWAWVEVPTLSVTADTVLYIYYAGPSSGATNQNPTGVWDTNYQGVWHLKENPTVTNCGAAKEACDSTSNANHGDSVGAMVAGDQQTGKIDGSLNFDGVDDAINFPNISAIEGVAQVTMSTWVKPDTLGDFRCFIGHSDSNTNRVDIQLSGPNEGGNNDFEFIVANGSNTGGYTTGNFVGVGSWVHAALVFDGSQTGNANRLKAYVNGVKVALTFFTGTVPATTPTVTEVPSIGKVCAAEWDGLIDEAHISNSARSSGWINTEYNNQVSPGFFSLGGQQTQTVSEPLLKVRGGVEFR